MVLISDAELVKLMEQSMAQIETKVYSPAQMVKNRMGLYWGDRGFLEEYNKQLMALGLLEERKIVESIPISIGNSSVNSKIVGYRKKYPE